MYKNENIVKRTPINAFQLATANNYITNFLEGLEISKVDRITNFKNLLSEDTINSISEQVKNALANLEIISFDDLLEHYFLTEQSKYASLIREEGYCPYGEVLQDLDDKEYVVFLDKSTAESFIPGTLTNIYPVIVKQDSNGEYKVEFSEW